MLLESIDEQSTFMIGGWVHRAAHGVERARAKPRLGGIEERARRLGVVATLEEAKESDAIVMKLVVSAILDRRDAAHQLPVARRKKQLTIGGTVEWIAFYVERIVNRDAEWWYPLGMIMAIVDLPRQIDEPAQIA